MDRPRAPLAGATAGLLFLGLGFAGDVRAQERAARHDHDAPSEPRVPESVDMEATASEEARLHLNRGFEALHNFGYEAARESFREAIRLEPGFVLAHWGEAFSFHYPFGFEGGEPDSVRAALGRLAPTPEARAALAPTSRERAYLDALERLAGPGSERERRIAFSRAMREVAETYAEDTEAWALYAISVFGTEQNIRGVPSARDEAARAARRVLARSPRHPGGLHYLIHALDTPETADRILDVAREYATVSRTASHALHMPSHVFLQLALWDEAIAANERAFEASERWVEETGRTLDDRDYHAADFLHYALLQQGRVREAHAWVAEVRRRRQRSDHWSARWYDAVWSARERIETARWGEAPLPESGFEGRDELLVRALDAARSGRLEEARSALSTIRARREAASGDASATFEEARWAVTQAEAEGALAAAEGRYPDAVAALERALAEEARLPPANETPDPVKPPLELMGEILLEAGDPEGAVDAFRRSLEVRRGRARSLLGLARAAEAAGDSATAAGAYRRLLDAWRRADADLPELEEAREYRRERR